MSESRRPVLFVKGNYGMTGGPETLIANLIGSMQAGPYRPHLVLLNRRGVPLAGVLDEKRLQAARSVLHWPGIPRSVVTAARLGAIVRESNPALLHTHDMRSNLVAYLLTRVRRIPWIAHVHGWLGATHRGRWLVYERIDRRLIRSADLVLVGSHKARREVLAAGVRHVEVVPNAVVVPPISRFERQGRRIRGELLDDQASVVVGMVGRVHPGKGQETLVRAVAAAVREGLAVRGLIIGEGPDLQRLRQLTGSLGLDDHVTLKGFVDDIGPYVAAMDVFAVPSLNESLPLTALEAMALERPVIASRVGDLPRVIDDGESGLLVDPGDEHDLYRALKRLVADRDLRRRMGVRARRTVVEGYSVEAAAAALQKVYDDVLEGRDGYAATD